MCIVHTYRAEERKLIASGIPRATRALSAATHARGAAVALRPVARAALRAGPDLTVRLGTPDPGRA